MTTPILFDYDVSDDERRAMLYDGALFVYSPRASTQTFCEFAFELCREAFDPLDPETAQHELPVEEYAAILAKLKPHFIHHPESKRYLKAMLEDYGCDPEQTYFDVPRLRTSTSDGYLTAGIAFAFHPHRDTWYSAPGSQLNWWLPINELTTDNGLALHPRFFSEPVANSSSCYDYYRWNATGRRAAAKQVKKDTRIQPKPEQEIPASSEIRPISQPGGLLIFSGAQLHASVPNTSGRTRLSIDFRTVHRGDVKAMRGAPNIDWACTGTTLRDYLRMTDLTRLPDELVALYDTEPPPEDAETIYTPPGA